MTTDPALLAEKIKALDETAAAQKAAAAGAGDAPAANQPGANQPAANYNVAPTTTVNAVVTRHAEPEDDATRRLRSMRWGLVPPWVKAGPDGAPEGKGPLLINARAETITSSPAFRSSAKTKRCLVPMDGWYEWRPNPVAGGAKKATKTPFYMYADDGEPLLMAGLWSTWRPTGKSSAPMDIAPLLSCTIITTESAGPLSDIHDRMPLTISARDWDRWLDPDAVIDEGLLRGHGDLDRIAIREVSTLVNSIRNNGPELIEASTAPDGPDGLF